MSTSNELATKCTAKPSRVDILIDRELWNCSPYSCVWSQISFLKLTNTRWTAKPTFKEARRIWTRLINRLVIRTTKGHWLMGARHASSIGFPANNCSCCSCRDDEKIESIEDFLCHCLDWLHLDGGYIHHYFFDCLSDLNWTKMSIPAPVLQHIIWHSNICNAGQRSEGFGFPERNILHKIYGRVRVASWYRGRLQDELNELYSFNDMNLVQAPRELRDFCRIFLVLVGLLNFWKQLENLRRVYFVAVSAQQITPSPVG